MKNIRNTKNAFGGGTLVGLIVDATAMSLITAIIVPICQKMVTIVFFGNVNPKGEIDVTLRDRNFKTNNTHFQSWMNMLYLNKFMVSS